MGGEALAVTEMNRFKNVVISGRFYREDSMAGEKGGGHHSLTRQGHYVLNLVC